MLLALLMITMAGCGKEPDRNEPQGEVPSAPNTIESGNADATSDPPPSQELSQTVEDEATELVIQISAGETVVTLVWIQDAGYDKTRESFEKTLCNLQTDYLDMPYGDYHESWRAMEELYIEGKIKAIGVCNFLPDRLVDLILSHQIVPAVNQIELHPFCQQKEFRQVMQQYNIEAMSRAPFTEGREGIFQNETLADIGSAYEKTPAQVILRWLRQSNIIAIPKSVYDERIKEKFAIDDFVLSGSDMKRIENMDMTKNMILEIQSLIV